MPHVTLTDQVADQARTILTNALVRLSLEDVHQHAAEIDHVKSIIAAQPNLKYQDLLLYWRTLGKALALYVKEQKDELQRMQNTYTPTSDIERAKQQHRRASTLYTWLNDEADKLMQAR